MSDNRVEASCHCGAVRIVLEFAPERVTDCNSSICRRYGVLLAYYQREQVRFERVAPVFDTYQWGEKSLQFFRCQTCGCVTHWAAVDPGVSRMGINARLMAPDVLAAAKVRRLDGASTWEYRED